MYNFDTVRAYDEAEYQREVLECQRYHAGYVRKPYRGSLLLKQVRVSTAVPVESVRLSMAAGYIYLRLCDSSSGLLKRHIPYCYRRGRFHGRREGKYRRWDMRLDANGREALVEELERRIWAYEEERLEGLLTQWDGGARSASYFVDEAGYCGLVTHIVFSDKSALERVRFHSLLDDCRALEQSDSVLRDAVQVERDLLSRFIATEYVDVISSYEPKVVPMPGRYRLLTTSRG
jgi:hypothetical protein